jgi:hypothetical protein
MYRRSSRFTTAPTPSFAAPCITSRCASATRRTRCLPSDSNPAPTLQRRPCSPGSGAARLLPSASGIFPRPEPRRPAGCTSPHSSRQNRAWNPFPLASRQGFCTPRRRSRPRRRSARRQPPRAVQIRPLGLRPQGLGGALWRLIIASSSAKLVPPPLPPGHYCACEWGPSHTCVVSTVSPPTPNSCTVLYCLSY